MGKRIEINLEFEDSTKLIGKYLVFDTETTGLPINKNAPPDDFNNWPYVLQVAWLLFDDEHKLIEHNNFYLKQPVEIPVEATNIHGITTAMMLEQGIEPSKVYVNFMKAINNTEYLISHNIDFDVPIVHCDFLRNGLQWNFPNNKMICTMKSGASFCEISHRNGGFKWPKLTELYQKCFFPGHSMNLFQDAISTRNLHSANIDAALTAQCFFKLIDLGFFKELGNKTIANNSFAEQMKSNFENLHSINKSNDWTRNDDYLYVAEIKHLGLGTYRKLKNVSEWCLHDTIDKQFNKWDEKWEKISHKRKLQSDKEANLNTAQELTRDAQEQQKQIDELLTNSLNIDNTVDWDSLKDIKGFSKPMPSFIKPKAPDLPAPPTLPPKPVSPPLPEEPQETDMKFQPKLSIFDSVFIARKKGKIQKCKELFEIEHDRWQVECNDIIQTTRLRCDKWEAEGKRKGAEFNQSIEELNRIYEIKVKTAKNAYDANFDRWVKEKDEYCRNQDIQNKSVEERERLYFEKLPHAIVDYCEMVLNNSQYPETFPKDINLDYNSDSNLLIVEYVLPAPDDLPTLTGVKYIAAKTELKESFLSETQLSKIYESSIYKITLRTLHELFQADKAEALEVIIFNGWVNAIDRATGKKVSKCIITYFPHPLIACAV